MLLTIRATHQPATDLGFLFHKHPEHVHIREFPFGNATVFYPEATEQACTAAVLLDVDPVGMVRSANPNSRRWSCRFRRVHECVFGVLVLESEPVDPRL
jgi:RNA repair, ligase-Pnkp-associating, region of Hen1/PNKP adenylyltransferase domain, C-terminal region